MRDDLINDYVRDWLSYTGGDEPLKKLQSLYARLKPDEQGEASYRIAQVTTGATNSE